MVTAQIDFVIITALEVERRAVCSALGLTDDQRVRRASRVYWRGRLDLKSGGFYEVAVTQSPDMANVDAALVTAHALHDWDPGAALMVGIAAAAGEEQNLGDVIVGSDVYYYERGKVKPDGIRLEPKMYPADAALWRNVSALPTWTTPILAARPDGTNERPKVSKGVIASGEQVIAHAAVRDQIAQGHRKILAIEMEGYGFSAAVWQSFQPVRHLVIRGICDLADASKNDAWHLYAAASAASFTAHLLLDEPLDPLNPKTTPLQPEDKALSDPLDNRSGSPVRQTTRTANATFATEIDQTNRSTMLRIVRRNWIEGVLHKSLWNEARLILNMEGRPDAVIRPCELTLRRAGHVDTTIPPGMLILEVYRNEQEELLLLGEPGSGKTTLLLEIAETLLQEAETDPTLPIPVIFGLSAWRKEHTRLDTWLVEQLNRDYGISEKIGKRWVEKGALLLLLDGLDEVAESRRAACVAAINVYRQKHQTVLRPMVVSCRTMEYEAIPNLRLSGAVVIHPLTMEQVDTYLSEGGEALSGLRAVLADEPVLYELFSTPLMLHVSVMAYQGQSASALRQNVTIEERRKQLWDAYIERMFERKQEAEPPYEKAQAIDWLGWLGTYLTRNDLQKYLIEGMQPDDLPHSGQTFLVRWLLTILFVAPVCVFTCVAMVRFRAYVPLGIVMILACGLMCYNREIELQPIRRFSLRHVSHNWKFMLYAVLNGGLTGGMGGSVSGALYATALLGVRGVQTGAEIGSIFGAAGGAALIGIPAIFNESLIEDTVHPNEGIHHSLYMAVIGMALGAVIGAALFGAIIRAALFGAIIRAVAGEMLGAVVGAIVGLEHFGGNTVFQHYLLRLLLWRSGKFPRDITAFLDWTAQRALVQRVGGGWRFVHRTLQERFAERYNGR